MAYLPPKVRPNFLPEKDKSMKRLNPNKEIYWSYRWKKLTIRFKRNNPICVHCKTSGRITAMEVVDHILSINHGGDPWDERNLQPLCKKCHDKKSAKEAHYGKDV
jgi:5-methylcytosine-specific restriction protein A